MIEINLLPEERRKKQERFKKFDLSEFKLQDTAIFTIIAAVFGILIVVQIVMVIAGWTIKANLSSLEKKYNAILPQKEEADALKFQIDLVNKKVRAIDELMVNRFSWAMKLGYLNDSMIPGVWLSQLDYDETGGGPSAVQRPNSTVKTVASKARSRYLILNGYAMNTGDEGNAIIGKFIRSLKRNTGFYSDVADIQLGYTRAEKIKDQEVVNFKITCLFKEKTK